MTFPSSSPGCDDFRQTLRLHRRQLLQVDALTGRLQSDGYRVTGLPRWTGDGFYESVILDPDGNRVEITI